jgi:hypothetical protein
MRVGFLLVNERGGNQRMVLEPSITDVLLQLLWRGPSTVYLIEREGYPGSEKFRFLFGHVGYKESINQKRDRTLA